MWIDKDAVMCNVELAKQALTRLIDVAKDNSPDSSTIRHFLLCCFNPISTPYWTCAFDKLDEPLFSDCMRVLGNEYRFYPELMDTLAPCS